MQKKCTHKVYQGKILYTSKIVQKNEKKKKKQTYLRSYSEVKYKKG